MWNKGRNKAPEEYDQLFTNFEKIFLSKAIYFIEEIYCKLHSSSITANTPLTLQSPKVSSSLVKLLFSYHV